MSVPTREEAPVIFREPILYREWGHRLANLGRNSSAIDYFEKATELAGAEELRTLIGHCKVLIRDAKYPAALKLSEKCMEIGMHDRRYRFEQLGEAQSGGVTSLHASAL